MTDAHRVKAPTADEIEHRFRHPVVMLTRPMVLGVLGVLGAVRRFKWTARGAHRLTRGQPPLLFAANHCSHADTAAILGTLPWRIRRRTCVAAALDVFGPAKRRGPGYRMKAFRRECLQLLVAAGFRAFAFDRYGPPIRSLRTVSDLIDHGWSVLLYPEGTRSRTGKMAEFKPGVGLIAKATGRPVIPIHVTGGNAILPCGAFLPRSARAVVRYGEPLWYQRGESVSDFVARVQEHVLALAPRTTAPEVVVPRKLFKGRARFAAAGGAEAPKPRY